MADQASVQRTIKFISRMGTYTAYVMSKAGDLHQYYDSQTPGTAVSPSYEDSTSKFYQPVLRLYVTNSRETDTVTPADVDFYVGEAKVVFDASGLSTGLLSGSVLDPSFKGVFQKVTPGNGELYFGLKILKNLPELLLWASTVIKMVAKINPPNSTLLDDITVTYPIKISQKTSDSAMVTITSPDFFAITEKGGTCRLSAVVMMGGQEMNTGWTFNYYQMTSDGYEKKHTGKDYTVSEADVHTSAIFRVEAISATGQKIYDVATVVDASDPYDIEACPTPADETIDEDPKSERSSVVYNPKLVTRADKKEVKDAKFKFILTDYAGNILNPNNYKTPQTSFTVTRDDCNQGEDLSLTIIAV